MKAYASSFHAWKLLERQEGVKAQHGLTFPLAVLEAIGRPHGLTLTAEEGCPDGPAGFDAVFLSVLDSRCMVPAATHFARWQVPFRSVDRRPVGRWPLVWAGGQGLHNPLPLAPVADLVVIGDAEGPLPALLRLWESWGNSDRFLDEAARVPGVFVPSIHDRRVDTIDQSVADDIGVTLRNDVSVNLDGTRRVEIARGCKFKCTFCSLGWRAPLRENTAGDVVATIRSGPRRVHLQAGDAESHSGIDEIRSELRAHGGFDSGWTGRMDSLFENPDQTIPGGKRYAFGVEGVAYRLRKAVGKGYLTDDRLVEDTARFFSTIEEGTRGRAAWHMIAGLPTERPGDVMALDAVVRRVDRARRGKERRNLSVHWQPFQPLPGTPMQWCPAGGGARRKASMLRGLERLDWVGVRHVVGRTDAMAQVCTSLSRADERGADLLEALAAGPVSPADAVAITGSPWGQLPVDEPTPWGFVRQQWGDGRLRRAYDTMMTRFAHVPRKY